MPISLLLATLLAATLEVPPVPGLCTAPVPADQDAAGCYSTNTLALHDAPESLFWHIQQFDTLAAAQAEAARHRWSAVAQAHGRIWLYVLGDAHQAIAGGTPRAVIGPLMVPAGPAKAYFAEAVFPPGMRTRVHAHPGPEAFYVVEGEQCMETPGDRRIIPAGGSDIVTGGLHIQGAPKGRRNLVLILAPTAAAPVMPGGDWVPSDFCN